MSQRGLATACGLSPAYVATLERGTSEPPPLSTCNSLARALAIAPDELWERSFTARLARWLKREGFPNMSETEILEIVKTIKSKSR